MRINQLHRLTAAAIICGLLTTGCGSTQTTVSSAGAPSTPPAAASEAQVSASALTSESAPATTTFSSPTTTAASTNAPTLTPTRPRIATTTPALSNPTAPAGSTTTPVPAESTTRPVARTSEVVQESESTTPPAATTHEAPQPPRPAATGGATPPATRTSTASPVQASTPAARVPVVTTRTYTQTQAIPQPADQTVHDATMTVGQSMITRKGHPGLKVITYSQRVVDGRDAGSPAVVSSAVTVDAIATVIKVGVKPVPVTWRQSSGLAASTVAAINSWRASHGLLRLNPGWQCPVSDGLAWAESEGAGGGCGMDAWGFDTGSNVVAAWAAEPSHRVSLEDTSVTGLTCVSFVRSDGSGSSVSCSFS